MVIGIIGGGASGMTAALAAAENPNAQIIIFERQARVGRKLQATGNGRCNITNLNAGPKRYHSELPEFVEPAIGMMDPENTLKWFQEMGLYTVAESTGRVYPYSDQANSVVDILRFALNKFNIQLRLGAEVTKVKKTSEGFKVSTEEDETLCDRVIIACGGLAGTKLGGSMSGYKLLSKLGHKITRLRPALVQLKSSWSGVSALKGVRANVRAEILFEGVLFSQSMGELQFTEYGLSGPVIFEVSRDACQSAGDWTCRLDFIPHISESVLYNELLSRREKKFSSDELLTGILHNRLGRVLTKAAGVPGNQCADTISDTQLKSVCNTVKFLEIPLIEPLGMDSAQVTAGGAMVKDFVPETMESRIVPGLYACGEVLDVDGDCGGYNLQWAWSSGWCAGKNAGKDLS